MKNQLSMSLKQKLNMNVDLRQSIQILQYSHNELVEFVKNEALENPTLEVDLPNLSSMKVTTTGGSPITNSDNDSFESFTSKGTSLIDYVKTQWGEQSISDEERVIGLHMLASLNDNGFLDLNIGRFVKKHGYDKNLIRVVLARLQTLDPPGVCARSSTESLYIQARRKNFSDITLEIIRQDLELIARSRWDELSQKYNIDLNEVNRINKNIKSLNPRPVSSIEVDTEDTRFIIPDLILTELENGEYEISFNDNYYPKIYISDEYLALFKASKDDKEVYEYLKEKLHRSQWLVRSIEQRRTTILKIANAIVESQKNYIFSNENQKPLRMQDIAEKIDMHISSISRTVNHKYIQTPKKVYELKEFFQVGLASADGLVSSSTIKSKLGDLIRDESKQKPLSDQKISDLLKKDGIQVSRRTVAKYRESMKIPNSQFRKEDSKR